MGPMNAAATTAATPAAIRRARTLGASKAQAEAAGNHTEAQRYQRLAWKLRDRQESYEAAAEVDRNFDEAYRGAAWMMGIASSW
jgi:hypothetical protein